MTRNILTCSYNFMFYIVNIDPHCKSTQIKKFNASVVKFMKLVGYFREYHGKRGGNKNLDAGNTYCVDGFLFIYLLT